MADDVTDDDTPLTLEEVLTFGPVVEAVVWHDCWLQETRAPAAVAAGRPRFGPVFNSDGVGRAVIIRPCVSRGRRVRGLPPVYTPQMLERNASVFTGWPSFLDHAPDAVREALAKQGRSVKELGGQILSTRWNPTFEHEDDGQYGYRRGGIVGDIWATPMVREMVGENPSLLHLSINAWPTSGKPGPVPWRTGMKGMLIEGIRRQPQGSVDYVVRGGAGGRLLVEGVEDEGAWPEVGEWAQEDVRLVVSLAESFYASPAMRDLTLPDTPAEMRNWLSEHAPHLLPALQESSDNDADDRPGKRKRRADNDGDDSAMTEADVRRIMSESMSGMPTVEEFERRLQEQTTRTLAEREQQRALSARAEQLIERAEGILPQWKADLKARYAMTPDGPPPTLLVEAEVDDNGRELSEMQVLERRVENDLTNCRELIAEAQGKPRVRGEGARRPDPGEARRRVSVPHWRGEFARMGLVESEDKAVEMFGASVEG